MQLQDTGAGIPDGGFFTAEQFSRDADIKEAASHLLPARGALEVKSPADDVHAIAHSDQVIKYLRQYRLVLVTNLRAFILMELDQQGRAVALESHTLAESEADFWQLAAHPRAAAERHGERLTEYLKRVMLHPAPLPKRRGVFRASQRRAIPSRSGCLQVDVFPVLPSSIEKASGCVRMPSREFNKR